MSAKRFKPIGLTELRQMILGAGYHHTDGPHGQAYNGGPGWGLVDYDEAADRLASAIIKRVNDFHRVPDDDSHSRD